MERTPRGYFVFVVAGLGGVLASTVWTAIRHSNDPTGGPTLLVALAGLTIWFAIFFAFWFYWLIFRRPEPPSAGPGRDGGLPDLSSLRSWSTLAEAMVLTEDPEALRRAEGRARRGIALFLLFGLLFCAAVFIGPWLSISGVDRIGGIEVMTMWPFMVLAFPAAYVLFLLFGGLFSSAVETGDEMLEPLGLAIAQVPEITLVPNVGGGARAVSAGESVVAGERHGRAVEIHVAGGGSSTMLQTSVPEFQVRSDHGKLVAEGDVPSGVREALRGLPRAKRWRGVRISGGEDGIVVGRRRDVSNGWLYDLWLAERLASRLEG